MRSRYLCIVIALACCCFSFPATGGESHTTRGNQFIAFNSFRNFAKSAGDASGEFVLTSRPIRARIEWDELVASWNLEGAPDASLKVEVRALHGGHVTKWFCMGLWSVNPTNHTRESVRGQKDSDGDVDTDTLVLKQPAREFQLRLTLSNAASRSSRLKFASVSLLNTRTARAALPPNRKAWGRLIDVPERSQMVYENGWVICSPTTVSMMLAHWSRELNSVALDEGVPGVVKGVYDPQWKGTGNWAFNMAYAGSFKGIRAYTARLSDVSELEDWVAQGIPVGLSVCYNLLRSKGESGNGHLVVCVGFTENGDVIINDPGTTKNVRKTFSRANLIKAWAYSKNACYFVYPEDASVPRDRFGHWDSWTARSKIELLRPSTDIQ
ncbi:MAG: hypothetical protein HOP33_10580 [Verrucomicrobia bacterium]|nr:hypothetical protein [Verrucomicrobiota bacterium]